MREHIKVLGLIHVVLGIMGALGGVAALVILSGTAGFIGVAGRGDPDAVAAIPALVIVGLFVCLLLLVLSVPSVLAGYGLLKARPWARVLTIVVSVLSLFSIPIGTLVGIYGLWVVVQPEAEAILAGRQPL